MLKFWPGFILVAGLLLGAHSAHAAGYVADELLVKIGGGAGSIGPKRSLRAAAVSQRLALANRAHAAVGARQLRDYYVVGWQRVKLPKGLGVPQAMARYRAQPGVLSVEPNYKVSSRFADG